MSQAAKAGKARGVPGEDPVLAAVRCAPIGPPMTDDERRAMEEAGEIGRWRSGADVHDEIARRCAGT
jgi:hypothetical protein